MTKDQTTPIPEELYNLTQLAEVTLAAGRLSTTNIEEIKEYINSSNKYLECPDSEKGQESVLAFNSTTDVVLSEMKCITHNANCSNNNSINTNNKNNDNENNNLRSTSSEVLTMLKTRTVEAQEASIQATTSTPTSASTSATLYSSSDDDSNYYSHKVFDRKKLRRSTISDSNSRFEDSRSYSSAPSSSASSINGSINGDEQASSLGHDCTDEDSTTTGSVKCGNVLGLLDDEHICPECGKKYSTSSNLARHRQTHRSIMDKKARRCPHCEKVYVSMPAYSMHVRTHNQGCECSYCGKCFSRPWLLQGHIRTHTGEKPFKCNVCSKAFADKSNLRAHIQTHSNTKPHTCARCGKAFALKSYLYKHEESSCMKNRNSERETRPNTRSIVATTASAPAKSNNFPTNYANQATDNAKSTLANKLLQKEKDRRQAALKFTNLPAEAVAPLTDLNGPPLPELPSTYTMLTTPMCQKDYERFQRISVIQPTVLPHPNAIYQEHFPVSLYQHHHHHLHQHSTTPAAASQEVGSQIQEQPMDFSPKNNFTHSTKTSPFELTGNYAMVA